MADTDEKKKKITSLDDFLLAAAESAESQIDIGLIASGKLRNEPNNRVGITVACGAFSAASLKFVDDMKTFAEYLKTVDPSKLKPEEIGDLNKTVRMLNKVDNTSSQLTGLCADTLDGFDAERNKNKKPSASPTFMPS